MNQIDETQSILVKISSKICRFYNTGNLQTDQICLEHLKEFIELNSKKRRLKMNNLKR